MYIWNGQPTGPKGEVPENLFSQTLMYVLSLNGVSQKRNQSSQNRETSKMSLRLAARNVILQLSLSLFAYSERYKLLSQREEDRGTSSLLQPTLLLFCQAGCFGHTSRVKVNGSENHSKTGNSNDVTEQERKRPINLKQCRHKKTKTNKIHMHITFIFPIIIMLH